VVQERVRNRLQKASIKAGLGEALLDLIELQTGDSVGRICDVDTADSLIRFEYEVDGPTYSLQPMPLPQLSVE
jgi:hypothetical protein